jgi:hypothetical protein
MATETLSTPLEADDIETLEQLAKEDSRGIGAAREYALEIAGASPKGKVIEVVDASGEVTTISVHSIGKAAVRPPVAIENPAYVQAQADNWRSKNQ